MSGENIKEVVREKYSEAARRAQSGEKASCGCCSTPGQTDPITSNLYDPAKSPGSRKRRCSPRLPAGIPLRLPGCVPAKSCSTSARAVELWIGCLAGALEEGEYRRELAEAGFVEIEVEPTRIYRAEDARELLLQAGLDAAKIAPLVDGKFMSVFVRARKPS